MIQFATLFTFSGVTAPAGSPLVIFNPASFGAALKAWFSADQGLTVVGTRATAWAGLGPASALSLVGVNGGLNLVAAAQNGMPGVKAIGTNADTSAAQGLGYSTAQNTFYAPLNFNYNQPFTASIAFLNSPSAGNNAIIGQGSASGFGWWLGYRNGKLAFFLFGSGGYGNNWIGVNTGAYLASGQPGIFQVIYTGATGTVNDVTLYVNGVAIGPSTVQNEANGTLTGGTQCTTGGPPFGVDPSGQFGIADQTTVLEFMVANVAATSAQIASLDKYLNGRWAIHS